MWAEGEGGRFMYKIKSEKGFTLIELVVAVALLSGVMACLYFFFAYSMKSYDFVQDHYQAEVSARKSVSRISKDIRRAKAVTIASTKHYAVEILDSGMTVNVYTDIDNDLVMELVKYKITGTTLKVGTAELGNTPTSYSVMAEKVNNLYEATAVPAFTVSGKQVMIDLRIKSSTGSLKEEPVSVTTSVAVRSKGAMN